MNSRKKRTSPFGGKRERLRERNRGGGALMERSGATGKEETGGRGGRGRGEGRGEGGGGVVGGRGLEELGEEEVGNVGGEEGEEGGDGEGRGEVLIFDGNVLNNN